MANNKNLFLWLTLIFFLAYTGWLVWETSRPARTNSGKPRPPSLEISTVELNEVAGQEKIWTLKARRARVEENTRQTFLEQVSGTFFQDGRPLFTLVCPKLAVDYQKGEVVIERPQIEFYEKNQARVWQITGDRFFWRGAAKSLRGQGRVTARAEADDLTIKTDRLEFTRADLFWRLTPAVAAVWRGIEMRGGPGQYQGEAKKLVISGPVSFRRGLDQAGCGRLSADLPAGRIDLEGGLDFKTSDLTITARTGHYRMDQERLVLQGDPRAQSPGWSTSGREMTYDWRTQKLKISGQGEVTVKP